MEFIKIMSLFLGSSVMVAIINLVIDRWRRKDTVHDRDDTINARLSQVDNRIEIIEQKVDKLAESTISLGKLTKAQAYDNIRRTCYEYIKLGRIDRSELEKLNEMYRVYVKVTGENDSFLECIMDEVYKLRVVCD